MEENNNSILISSCDLNRLFDRHNVPDDNRQSDCELVCPGNFQIKTDSSGFLSSYLGSGVGVALYDEIAGIGGMIHFLLSEPVGRSWARQPEHYARTGLQYFIDTLVSRGAQKARLKASVAGGMLMGQPSDMAKDLGSGQMTSDVVMQLLAQQQIPLEQVAVGGLNPCSMLLNTARWQVTIKLLNSKYSGSSFAMPAKPTAEKICQAIAAIKPIPQVALKVLQLMAQQTDTKFDDLAEEIKKDQVIASRVLHYCNAPVFGFSQNIASIERALVLLGENNLLEIVISSAVNYTYTDKDNGYALMQGGLYRHALAAAYVAKEIANFTGSVDPGQAYTAGLIHDIGKIVLDGFVADLLPFFYQHLEQQTADLNAFESQQFDTNHMEVGAKLATKWELPENLTAAISYHHTPERAPEGVQKLVYVTYLADLLATHYLAGVELERVTTDQLESGLTAVGLRSSQLPLIIDNIPWMKLMHM
jgi:putative nucleotidyltransferase with HDIG domain